MFGTKMRLKYSLSTCIILLGQLMEATIIMITTKRLTIRPIEAKDWIAIKEIWDDFKKTEFVVYDNFKDTTPESLQPRIAKWAEVTRQGNEHMFFATCLNDEMIGFTSMNIVASSEYEIGYGYTNKSHGHGYAQEVLGAILEYMKKLGATKIHAGTALRNVPSVILLKRLIILRQRMNRICKKHQLMKCFRQDGSHCRKSEKNTSMATAVSV